MMLSPARPLDYEHQRALSRPSCPRCGQPCILPDASEYLSGSVRNTWSCQPCNHVFHTVVEVTLLWEAAEAPVPRGA